MKRLLLLLASVVSIAAADTPTLPTELQLASGAVLRNASATRWERDQVIVRHVAGIDPVRYANIAASQRHQVLAARDAALKAKPPEATTPSPPAKASPLIEGQAFIVTRGAGNYTLGSMTVYAFPADRAAAFESFATIDLGKPLASGRTDAEGRFKLSLPSDTAFFLFARSHRDVGRTTESYEWLVKSSEITDRGRVLLTSHNVRQPTPRAIRIDHD